MTKESKATKSRKNKSADISAMINVSSIHGISTEGEKKTPLERYSRERVKDSSQSFNWHLDNVINENWAFMNGLFTADECDKIIEIGKSGSKASPLAYGVTGGDEAVVPDTDENFDRYSKVRVSPVSWLRADIKENHWIFEKIARSTVDINNQFFNYDLTEIQSLQFTAYDSEEEGFYDKHIDMMYKSNGTRKLSLSVQLTPPENYEGGNLSLYHGKEPVILPKTRGTGLFFPSYSLHEVTPVTKGIRYSLVAWILGPRFK
jgi:PKHD-type hydroxylase